MALCAQPAAAQTAYGVTEANALVRFNLASTNFTTVGPITGLIGAEQILAIDLRPINGRMYGVSANHLYAIDPATAVASAVTSTAFPAALVGSVGMDFDPVTGMIRIITDTGQNLRIDPVTGALTTDTSAGTGIVAIAFTNNYAGADRDTLYGIDATTDQLVRVGGANIADAGASQNAGTITSIGGLGFDTASLAGFDITANDNSGWAIMTGAADTESTLFRIDVATGAATSVNTFLFAPKLRAFAIVSRAVTLHGLTTANAIVTFLSASPGTLLPMGGGPVAILGLGSNEFVVAIDVRPFSGELYGITTEARLLVIDPTTGESRNIGTLNEPLSGVPDGFDFDLVNDRVRITTNTGQNLSVNPTNATVVPQTTLSIPTTVALAYTPASGGTTTLYGIDAASDRLVTFANPANGVGTLSTPLGVDAESLTAFDVSAVDGTAFFTTPTTPSMLYTISLPAGVVRPVGPIGGGVTIRGLAAATPGYFRFTQGHYEALENVGTAIVEVERILGGNGPASVTLRVLPGSATDPDDFTGGTFLLEFAPGERSKTIGIPIVNDSIAEAGQSVNLSLINPQLGTGLITPSTSGLSILDDDPRLGVAGPTVTITSPTTEIRYEATSILVPIAGTATDDTRVQSVTWVNARGASGAATLGSAPAASVEWIVSDVKLFEGSNLITMTATDNLGNQTATQIDIVIYNLAFYLAEGATGSFFDMDLLLANPNTQSVTVTATFLKPLGQGTIVKHYTLPALSRRTIQVDTIPGLEDAEVSTIVTGPQSLPIFVERTMRWNSTGYGAHTDKASQRTSLKWYFAEGSQGFFFTYLLLANPQNVQNDVTVRYLREGVSPVTRTYTLQPLERHTVDIGADAALVNTSFGMEVTFALPGIAERAMYFGLNPLWVGGHESVGVTEPSKQWFLAEGATGPFFETFVLFANPGTTSATVNVRYLPALGSPVDKTYTVAAGARLTVDIEGEDPSLTNAAVATQVTSSVPILVERAQYWPGPPDQWYEAHNSFGVTALSTRWGLAEGRMGGPDAYQTYILVANPNDATASVGVQFLLENGAPITKFFNVPAQSRLNIQVGIDVPEITTGSFGAVIGSSLPIAVERAMYSTVNGVVWQAGTNATATPLPPVTP
jgi:hypothetical protein